MTRRGIPPCKVPALKQGKEVRPLEKSVNVLGQNIHNNLSSLQVFPIYMSSLIF